MSLNESLTMFTDKLKDFDFVGYRTWPSWSNEKNM